MNTTHTNFLSFDVICIGAGLVGRMLALGLAQRGIKVASIDHHVYNPDDIKFLDGRTTSISWGSKLIFDQLGLWSLIEPYAAPIHNIRVMEGLSPWVLDYDAHDIGNHPMGYIVENEYVLKSLFAKEHVESLPNPHMLHVFAPASVSEIKRNDTEVTVTLNDGTCLKSPLIIGADGKESKVRENTSIGLTKKDYNQKALVVHITHDKPHNDTAFEIFLNEGPLAVLPLIPLKNEQHDTHFHRSGIVFCKSKDYDFYAQSDETICNTLMDHFPYLGTIKICSKRWVYPLSYMQVTSLIDKRLALAGDAGHVMHPIAGQGVNLGWRDVITLINLLDDAKQKGIDLGSPHLLKQYDRRRKPDRMRLLIATDLINRLYQVPFGPLKRSRNIAFAVLNRLVPIKRLIMRRAMGI